MERTGARLLWGTANLFSHPRYAAGAATNPDPEVFAYAAAQVKVHARGHPAAGRRELRAVGRPRGLRDAAQHRPRARGGPARALPDPGRRAQAPDRLRRARCCSSRSRRSRRSTSTTTTRRRSHGFLARHGLEGEYRVNIEVNHATLAGHSFHHEVATAIALGIFGSIDVNRGDYQNGWDTDQFPNSVDELALALYEILARRRLHDRRLQLRREAAPPEPGPDPICSTPTSAASTRWRGRCSWRPTCSSTGRCGIAREERYAGWSAELGARRSWRAAASLAELEARVAAGEDRPAPGIGSAGAAREPRQPGDLGRGPADS